MPKRIVPLTDIKVRTIKPAEKPIKLFDGGGLFLLVTAALLASCHSGEAAMAASMMSKALEEQSEETLQVEYARLFVGPFELAAPPYGSVYFEGNRRLMGDSTLAVRKMYQQYGLTLDVKEVPGHIALELEFMHYLCLREANAETGMDMNEVHRLAEAQSDFMKNFLEPWLADFCNMIRKTTESPFYHHLADCLEGFAAQTSPPLEGLKEPESIDEKTT